MVFKSDQIKSALSCNTTHSGLTSYWEILRTLSKWSWMFSFEIELEINRNSIPVCRHLWSLTINKTMYAFDLDLLFQNTSWYIFAKFLIHILKNDLSVVSLTILSKTKVPPIQNILRKFLDSGLKHSHFYCSINHDLDNSRIPLFFLKNKKWQKCNSF